MGGVVHFPRNSLPWARAVVEDADVHPRGDVEAATDLLVTLGSEDDFRRVETLYRARTVTRQQRLQEIIDKRRRSARLAHVLAIAFFGLFVVGIIKVAAWVFGLFVGAFT